MRRNQIAWPYRKGASPTAKTICPSARLGALLSSSLPADRVTICEAPSIGIGAHDGPFERDGKPSIAATHTRDFVSSKADGISYRIVD